jgi:hypothetical protein
MLIPDKYVAVERSLLGQAAAILEVKQPNQTVSELWSVLATSQSGWTFDRFALALALLFGLGVVRLDHGILDWGSR